MGVACECASSLLSVVAVCDDDRERREQWSATQRLCRPIQCAYHLAGKQTNNEENDTSEHRQHMYAYDY